MYNKKVMGAAVSAAMLLFAAQLEAQEEHTREVVSLKGDNFTVEEVVVTARKKSESLQSIPIAIDALNAVELEEKGITSLEQVAKYTTGLTFDVGILPNDTRPVIRGVNISRGRPNVALLIDSIDVSSETLTVAGGGAFANLNLLDLERIEVIKGPQSAVYGRSAFSGAVNYVTKRPQADQGVYGWAEGEYDEHDAWKGQVGVTVPIIEDSLAVAFSYLTSGFDGYYDNPNTGGDLGGANQDGASFALNFIGMEDFSAYFRAEYANDNYTPRAVVAEPSSSTYSEPTDFFLLGTANPDHGKKVPIPGGERGFPEPTQEECDIYAPFRYTNGFAPACATMLYGDVGHAKERDIDLGTNPNTGKDFKGTKIENTRLSLELDYQMDKMDIVSLTGYTDNKTSIEEDFDISDRELETLGPGSANFAPFYIGPADAAFTQFGVNTNSDTSFDYYQVSQEFRFSGDVDKLEWMVDLLYWYEDMNAVMNQMWWASDYMDTTFWNSALSATLLADLCTVPGDVSTCEGFTGVQTEMTPLKIPMHRNTESWSGALSFVYHVTDAIRATVEGRYISESLDYKSLPLSVFDNGFLNIPYVNPETGSTIPQYQHQSLNDSDFVPRYSLDWQATDDVFTYISAAKGFKPGGIATTDADGDIMFGHFKPETLWVYEWGFKTELLENRLQFNGALFYNDYTDQQIPYFVESDFGIANVSITNAGKSSIKGGEVEILYRPSMNWTFRAGWTHVKTEYEDFNISKLGDPGLYDKILSGNPEGDFEGKSFPNTPEDVAILSIRYDGEFAGSDWRYYTEVQGNYASKRYLDQGNLSYLPDSTVGEFNAGLTSDNWMIVAYVENFTDEDTIRSGLGNVNFGFMPGGQVPPFSANLVLPQPRTFGMRARYKF
ncbi:MAG: TonB-dependent receptor [Halioglobus sp.]|nr:TonB-dependent receptor [Halioglobus sp.]